MDQQRAAQVATLMRQEGFQALLCRLPEHVVMLTGYVPVLGNSFCLVTLEGEAPVCRLLVPEDEADLVPAGAVAAVRMFAEETLEHIGTTLDAVPGPLGDMLREAGVRRDARALGYEGGRHPAAPGYTQMGFPGAATLDLYRQVAPDVELRDASTILERLAAIKTHHDVAQIHRAAAAAREGMLVAHGAIRVERTEAYVAAVVTDSILRTAHDLSHTGQVQAHVHVMTGARSAHAYRSYNLTTAEPIAPGKPVLVQLEVCIDGYWVEVTRTFFAGELHSEWAAAHRVCLRAQEAALEAIHPGAVGRDVDHAARHVLAEVGLADAFKHGLGHGVGFQAINHAAPPILHPASEAVLEPGMVHNLEPAVYLEGNGGLRLNDDVLVGEHHPEQLTAMIPRGLDWLVVGA